MIAVPQVRAVTLKGYIEVARFVGLDPYAMLAEAGLSPTGLEDPEVRLPAAPVAKLVEDSASLSGCDSFGLLMQECRTYESLGPSALLFERLPDIRTVLAQISNYRRHMNDVFDLQLGDDDQHPTIEMFHRPDFATTQMTDMTVAMAHIVLTGASGRTWRPDAVHFHHSAPRDTSVFRRFFPAPVHFDSSFNGFECSPESLDRPLPGASAHMAENARLLLDGVELPPEEAPVSDRVIRSIMLFLPSGRATLEEVARSVDTPPRDLQRKLEREGKTFADLLNDARRELSQRYLTNDRQPLTTVAELTGYASPGSFSRWFVTEFGVAPGAWRKSLNMPSPQVC
jgi:AraC-like DNA-binding protein